MDKTLHSAEQGRLVELLRQMRVEARLTQAQVATRLGRPQSFVSKYESGERRLDLVELAAVAEALETDLGGIVHRFQAAGPARG
ncbi:MAG TPA: helix-turn-helix transcriptional regulator [Egibacteraceae bacterium]|nr:helix-turn-helix transcriptional regulator [Egibacteraceae bacterium]